MERPSLLEQVNSAGKWGERDSNPHGLSIKGILSLFHTLTGSRSGFFGSYALIGQGRYERACLLLFFLILLKFEIVVFRLSALVNLLI
jgi:hypothetical protein